MKLPTVFDMRSHGICCGHGVGGNAEPLAPYLLESLFIAFPCRRIDDEFLCEACDAFVDADVGLCRLQRQSSQTSSLVGTVNRTMTYGQTALVRIEGWHEHTRQWLSLWTRLLLM